MSPVAQAVLQSWSFPPYVTAINILAILLYFRGWLAMRAAMPERFTAWRLASFTSGIAALQIALASPIDTFDPFLLTNHMLQHMILMMIVPPLILLGDPAIPFLHGLPVRISRDALGPVLTWSPLKKLGRWLTNPGTAWLLLACAMLGWHIPAAYEFALRSQGWHEVEHACFLVASLLFWWPLIQPWPSRPQWPRWTMPVYLLLADFVNSALSAFLAFSDRVLYPSYAAVPRLAGISAQADQAAAGVSMWVIGSFAFLIPAVIITMKLLSPVPPKRAFERQPVPPETPFARFALPALILLLPIGALAYGWLAPDRIDADGTVVRAQSDSGSFHITVFTQAGPLQTGDQDVSILVQDRGTGEPVLDATVGLIAEQAGSAPENESVRATRQQSENKLLESATVRLPSAGQWNLKVVARRGPDEASLSATLQVDSPVAVSKSWFSSASANSSH